MSLSKDFIQSQSKLQSLEMVKQIMQARSAVVLAHVNPDGDTLASMLALAEVLEQAGIKHVDRVMHDPVPEIYRFLPDQEKVISSQEPSALLEEYDLSFSCDCGSIARLASAGMIWQRARTKCNIDHHLSNPLYADLNFVDPDATCTGQVVSSLAEMLPLKIQVDSDLASLYYITLLTDTGGFRHSNTDAKVFKWAQQLVYQGANPSHLHNQLFNQIPFRAIKIIGLALSRLEIFEINYQASKIRIAYTHSSKEDLMKVSARDEDTEEIVDHIMRIKNLDLCLYLREARLEGHFKGSLRSSSDDFDCSAIATELNGGGHARAAGFNIEANNHEELRDKIFDLISRR
jgi:bifunctional oligoribonuclease and PAP phosphatase NrnA